jgi:hypothetical protein
MTTLSHALCSSETKYRVVLWAVSRSGFPSLVLQQPSCALHLPLCQPELKLCFSFIVKKISHFVGFPKTTLPGGSSSGNGMRR